MEPKPVRLAITLGDPRGIGPEVALDAYRKLVPQSDVSFLFIGPDNAAIRPHVEDFIPVAAFDGTVAGAGACAGTAIETAIALAMRGDIDGMITAPIDKYALHEAGFDYPGHTEMLGELSGAQTVVMMLAAERTSVGGALRVVLATTHLPLARVPQAFTAELLIEQARVTHAALREDWGIDQPRLALCAFNPHASDGGRFGDEEARVYAPAIRRLLADGIQVSAPLPADTVFLRAARGEFDVVIAPYHDVGMAAFKTAAFGQGVNVTLGLPFVRTSPDHGTAMDIAGTGAADSSSMEAAIRLAIRLSRT